MNALTRFRLAIDGSNERSISDGKRLFSDSKTDVIIHQSMAAGHWLKLLNEKKIQASPSRSDHTLIDPFMVSFLFFLETFFVEFSTDMQ